MNESITDIVNAYQKAGYTLFPLGNYKNQKAPRDKNWQVIDYSDETAESLGPIFGVRLEDTDVVFDYDPKRKKTPHDLKAFFNEVGLGRQETFIVQSQSGGLHVLYKMQPLPAGFRFPGRVPGYQSIEIKSKGLYVVACGSVYDSRKEVDYDGDEYKYGVYIPFRHDPSKTLQCPPELIAALKPREANTTLPDSEFEYTDDDATKTQFIQYLMQEYALKAGTFQCACEGRKYGLSPAVNGQLIKDYLNPRREHQKTDKEIDHKVNNAYVYGQGNVGDLSPKTIFTGFTPDGADEEKHAIKWILGPPKPHALNGEQIPCIQNVVNHFTTPLYGSTQYPNPLLDSLAFNEHSGAIEFLKIMPWHKEKQDVWKDEDTIQCKYFISFEGHHRASTSDIQDALQIIARRKTYHPMKQWATTLVWDGIPRLDKLLIDYFRCEDSEYTRAVGKNTLIAAWARIYEPGCQHDSMLVLEGRQGIGKSQGVAALATPWYMDSPLKFDKDGIAVMRKAWIYEVAEMSFLKYENKLEEMRQFITCKVDACRMPYARFTEEYKRATIFIGTCNPDKHGYLIDEAGNRRFWPVWVHSVDLVALKRDRDQLFAEALTRYREGETYFLNTKELEFAAEYETKKRMVHDSLEDELINWLTLKPVDLALTNLNIINFAFSIPAIKAPRDINRRISKMMYSLGYDYVQKWNGGSRSRVWERDI